MKHPNDDAELRELLQEWTCPAPSDALANRVLHGRRRGWGAFLHGHIRVPIPVACGLAALVAGGVWRVATVGEAGCSGAALVSTVTHAWSAPKEVRKPAGPHVCVDAATC